MKKIKIVMPVAVHPIKAKIWKAIESGEIKHTMSLREIGKVIGINQAQQVKHHLETLRTMGTIDWENGTYKF